MKFQKGISLSGGLVFLVSTFIQTGIAGEEEPFYYNEDGVCVVSKAEKAANSDAKTFSVKVDTKNKETPSQAAERAKEKAKEEMCALTPSKGKDECVQQVAFPYSYKNKLGKTGLFGMVTEVTEVCILARINVQLIKAQQAKE